jgi:NAD-dependent deacetylase
MEQQIEALKEALVKAYRVSALTGAGISAESGVPTFRGADGLWRNYNVMELATPQAFARDPKLVWEFYNWRRDLITGLSFNPGHRALVDLEARVPQFTLITQNVDGLHLKAGSKNLIEIHGNLWKVRCTQCRAVSLDMSPNMGPLPKCRACGGLLRPHVVWFGESLDAALLNSAVQAARSCQVMLVIGTSAIVQPAASLAYEAKETGALVAEINLEETPNSGMMDFVLLGKSGEILPKLMEAWS